ncbi:hypothetical protein VTK73DRAFT_3717 [Phialemonium thermophilum]|uniref:LisH domain-containing protein n=1 Tax=Phialemonium thermophilum TaxID=223376 RepID=A0ABR3VGP7_9PEZI
MTGTIPMAPHGLADVDGADRLFLPPKSDAGSQGGFSSLLQRSSGILKPALDMDSAGLPSERGQGALIVRIISEYLTQPGFSTKDGSELDAAREALPPSDRISRAFMDAGFQAWFGYFLVSRAREGFQKDLMELSPAALQRVAAELAKVKPHRLVEERMLRVQTSSRGAKRRRTTQETPSEPQLTPREEPPSSVAPCPVMDPPPRRFFRDDGDRARSLSLDVASPEQDMSSAARPEPTATAGSSKNHNDDSAESSRADDSRKGRGRDDNRADAGAPPRALPPLCPNGPPAWPPVEAGNAKYRLEWPKAQNLPLVFSHYMCTAIFKSADRAAVALHLPPKSSQAWMSFYVSSDHVHHLASALFSTNILAVGQSRRVLHSNGITNVVICRSLELTGTTMLTIDTLLGQTVGSALKEIPRRRDEIAQGALLATECLAMHIPGVIDSPARLILAADAAAFQPIRQRLWQDGPTLSDPKQF